MSRRRKTNKREIELDSKFKDKTISKFVNVIMLDGKKTIAEKILYSILDKISKEKKVDANKFFHDVLSNVKPRVEVRSRRVGGATYQIPMEVKVDRSQALAIRWIIEAARKRGVDLSAQRARQVTTDDFKKFNYVLAMDAANLRILSELCPSDLASRISLFLDYAPSLKRREVPDPYHGGGRGFELVLDLIEAASNGLLSLISSYDL